VHRFVSIAALASLALVPRDARAEWTAGADVGVVIPTREPEVNPGWVAGVRGGYRFDLRAVKLGPELGVIYGAYTPLADAKKTVFAFWGGLRLSLEVPALTPFVYARGGFGTGKTDDLPDPNQRAKLASGAYVDIGIGVSRRLGPFFELGVDGGYALIEPGKCDCARWVHAGANGTFVF
jgi:hypothetical protein